MTENVLTYPAYTNFSYSDLEARSTAASGPIDGPIVSGGPRDLYDEVANVTAEIANSGGVQGAEVAQLYLAYPSSAGQPPKQLRGFDKLPLEAGESRRATFSLRKKDLAVWDAQREQWVIPSGTFEVLVGASSRDIRLRGRIEVA